MISQMLHALLLSVFPLFKFRFDASLIHTVFVDFIKPLVLASIPGFFVCMWCASKKHYLANNVLRVSSCIQLLFPTADAALPSSMLSVGDTVISGICIALVLCIAVPRGSKNRFFNYACLTVISIIMNWFQAVQGGGEQLALQYVACGVIGFVTVHCLWNGEVKQLMGKVWDLNMDGTKLKKLQGWVFHTANKDGERGEDNAAAVSEEDPRNIREENHYGHEDCGVASEDSDDEIQQCSMRAVQLLAIRANFYISSIMAYDWHAARSIYKACDVEEEGMVDLVPTGPATLIEAFGGFCLGVFTDEDEGSANPRICEEWDVSSTVEIEEFTQTIYGGLGRKVEITYLVVPEALEDLGTRSREVYVYGSIKASTIDYGNKSIYLFICEREMSFCFPGGSTFELPLHPDLIALQYHRHPKLHIEVDLKVITTYDSPEEDKNLKFCLDFTRRIRRQEREVDGDKIEVTITWIAGSI